MENQENLPISQDDMWRKLEKSHRRGKIMGGLLIIAIGSLFLARELGLEIPAWVLTWKMLLIGLGVVAAVKHKFLHPAWIILVGVGGAFLLNDLYPEMHIRPILWPVLIIAVGLFIVFKPHRKEMRYARHHWKNWHEDHRHWHKKWHHQHHEWYKDRFEERGERAEDGDYIDSVSILGSAKKNVISKNFKGGDIVNVFGGAHINLTQADFEGNVTLSVTQVFGGTKLIVPANWEIKMSESVTILGGIEDKRPVQPTLKDEKQRVLTLIGTTIFGGIEIKSFS